MHKSYLAHLLIAVTMGTFCFASCDSYNIVEPRFYSEGDIVDLPACEGYQGTGLYCCGDKLEKYINIYFTFRQPTCYRLYIFGRAGNVVRSYEGLGNVGLNVITWDGRDKQGKKVEDGDYGISLKAGDYKELIWFKIS